MEQKKMLSIDEALKLHQRISPHFPPDFSDEETVLFLVDHLVKSMKDNQPSDYLMSIVIMSGMSLDEIVEKDTHEILSLFAEGIKENRVHDLMSFGEFLGM